MAILYGSVAYGGNDNFNDALFGTSNNDFIYGLGGNDHLFGNGGSDYIDGGKGADVMYGGPGSDKFTFKLGESTLANPDTIGDFVHFNWNSYASGDHIDAAVAGSAANYQEYDLRTLGLGGNGYDANLQQAASNFFAVINNFGTKNDVKYLFVTDGHDGYLFADLDGNGLADSAMILTGLSSVNYFDFHDII